LPHPIDKFDAETLPDPELNPLLNPLLGAHMGRWAEVYFTSPPEKRNQAVADLLRELKSAPPPESGPVPAIKNENRENEIQALQSSLPSPRKRNPSPLAKPAGTIMRWDKNFVGCAAPHCNFRSIPTRRNSSQRRPFLKTAGATQSLLVLFPRRSTRVNRRTSPPSLTRITIT